MPNNELKQNNSGELDSVEFGENSFQEETPIEKEIASQLKRDVNHLVFSNSPQVILAAGSIINPDATVINIIATVGGGAVTLTSNPSIADGVNGQLLILRGSSATDTITLTDGNGILLAGDVTLGLNDTIILYYDGLVTNDWVEISRNLNTVQTYTASNVTTDRAYDADTVAIAELADVVGTLINDLKTWGIIK